LRQGLSSLQELSGWQETAVMAGQSKPRNTDKQITGLKYFEKLLPLAEERGRLNDGSTS
jgi:hypothetical protein